MKPAVVNASPLIVLGRAGLLELLPSIFSSIVVPRAVVEEIAAGAVDDPLNALLSGSRWLSLVETNALLSRLAFARLGRGETEVLEDARTHAGTVAVLDDKAARRAAVYRGARPGCYACFGFCAFCASLRPNLRAIFTTDYADSADRNADSSLISEHP